MTRPVRARWIPFNRQQVTSTSRFGWPALAMAARQAYCSHLPDVSLFRYFILTDRNCSGDDGAGTHVTSVSGQVKIVFSHSCPRGRNRSPLHLHPMVLMGGMSGQYCSACRHDTASTLVTDRGYLSLICLRKHKRHAHIHRTQGSLTMAICTTNGAKSGHN
jgi:hypothetical protein